MTSEAFSSRTTIKSSLPGTDTGTIGATDASCAAQFTDFTGATFCHVATEGLKAIPLGLSPLLVKNFGLVPQILNGVGLAEFPLNNLGSSPKVVEDFGQEALALTQLGEEEKALNGHGYQANPLQGSGQKPILVNVKKVKPKLLVSYKVPAVYVSETIRPQLVLLK